MRRHIIGGLALVCLVVGGVGYLGGAARDNSATFALASAIRIGLVLGAIWLAYAQVERIKLFLDRLPSWFFVALIGGVALVARFPWLALLVGPALFILWLMKPLPPSKRRSAAESPRRPRAS